MLKSDTKEVILKVSNLKKYFPIKNGVLSKSDSAVKAVDDVSFEVFQGETLGIVGESGCGKSTMAKVIIQLLEASDGSVEIEGKQIDSINKRGIKES